MYVDGEVEMVYKSGYWSERYRWRKSTNIREGKKLGARYRVPGYFYTKQNSKVAMVLGGLDGCLNKMKYL